MFRHYDDETLFQYVEGSSPIGEEIDAHAVDCALCAAEIASHRETIQLLEDEDVWNERAVPPVPPARFAEVASFASRLKKEDADAVTICDEALTGPAAWWATRLRKSPAARTAGVVRELIARVPQILERSPNDALQVTTLATETASALSITDYPSDTVITLRAQTLREHAFVLSIIGRYPEALATTDRAEMLFRQTPVPQYEIARLQLVKSNIYRCLDRFEEAIELASSSAETFLRFGDRKRHLNARLYEAGSLVRLKRSQQAIDIYRLIERESFIAGTVLHVQILHNMAECYRDLKRFDVAVEHLSRCTAEFDLLELGAYAAKSRWLLGTTLVAAGRPADAVP
ncbi:MAG TPA: tetratricopeptide repeat protein, partial [Thermoanaerobaculia bacterium]|nr:tetratricopeptide repeat protein [Thermoanaerobaculia bacterium]